LTEDGKIGRKSPGLAILGFSKLIFNIQQIEYQVEKRCRVSERAYSKK